MTEPLDMPAPPALHEVPAAVKEETKPRSWRWVPIALLLLVADVVAIWSLVRSLR